MLSFSKNNTITMTCLIMASLLSFTSPASASSANTLLRGSSSRTLQDPAVHSELYDKDDKDDLPDDFGPDDIQQYPSSNTGSTCPSRISHNDQCSLPEGHIEAMCFVSNTGVTVNNSYNLGGQANNKCRCYSQENPNPKWICSPLN